ncbi:TPA: hypothetical protein ACOEHG_004876 [Enterobacter ludwigii]
MAISKSPNTLGGTGNSSVAVDDITGATDTGKALLQAADDTAARQQIGAMGTEGDQVITGQLAVDKCLSVNLQGPEDPVNYQTLLQVKQPDGTACATISSYSQDAPGATLLRFSVLTRTGKLKKVMEIQGVDAGSIGGGSGYGGVEINPGSYLSVNNYLLDQVTATGYAVYTAGTKEDARTAIDAMGTDGDQVIDGHLQINDALTILGTDIPGGGVRVPIMELFDATSNLAASMTASRGSGDNMMHLGFAVRTNIGNVQDTFFITATDQLGTPGNNRSGVEVVNGGFLYVRGGYDLSKVTDTGFAVYTAQDEAAARTAIGAGTSNLTATSFGEQLLQCEDAAAVKALLGL